MRSSTFSNLTLYFSRITSFAILSPTGPVKVLADKFTNTALTIPRKSESITQPSTVTKWLTKILDLGNIWPKNSAGIANLKSRGIV